MNKKVLVIATHPDDEILGCGGTIARHVQNGDAVKSIVVCEGVSLRYGDREIDLEACRIQAAQVLGVSEHKCLKLLDQRLDTYPILEIVQKIEEEVFSFKPNIIYCQNGQDINHDHKIVFEAAKVAFRPLNEYVEEVFTYYTPSSTEWDGAQSFAPDTWVDITGYLDKKLEAFACYPSEVRDFPHPRSIEGLRHMAHFFGAQANMYAAECFQTVRKYVRCVK